MAINMDEENLDSKESDKVTFDEGSENRIDSKVETKDKESSIDKEGNKTKEMVTETDEDFKDDTGNPEKKLENTENDSQDEDNETKTLDSLNDKYKENNLNAEPNEGSINEDKIKKLGEENENPDQNDDTDKIIDEIEPNESMTNIQPEDNENKGDQNNEEYGNMANSDKEYIGNNGNSAGEGDSHGETTEDIDENNNIGNDTNINGNSNEEAILKNNENYLDEGKKAFNDSDYLSTKNQQNDESKKFGDEEIHKFGLKWIALGLIIIGIMLIVAFALSTKLQFTNTQQPVIGQSHVSTTSVNKPANNSISNLTTISVGKNPTSVVFSPDGKYAYVANSGSGTVSVINVSSNSVITTINVGADPGPLAITPNGKNIYVPNYNYSHSRNSCFFYTSWHI